MRQFPIENVLMEQTQQLVPLGGPEDVDRFFELAAQHLFPDSSIGNIERALQAGLPINLNSPHAAYQAAAKLGESSDDLVFQRSSNLEKPPNVNAAISLKLVKEILNRIEEKDPKIEVDIHVIVITLLQVLADRAIGGNSAACESLAETAAHAVGLLEDSLGNQQVVQMLVGLAAKCEGWPAMISHHPDWSRRNKVILSDLQVGSGLRELQNKKVRFLPGQGNDRSVFWTDFTRRLRDVAAAGRATGRTALHLSNPHPLFPWFLKCAALDELSRENASQWFEAGWDGLEIMFRGGERIPWLRHFGMDVFEATVMHKFPSTDVSETPDWSAESKVRYRIKEEAFAAFMSRFCGPNSN